jgi:hypothetical protein
MNIHRKWEGSAPIWMMMILYSETNQVSGQDRGYDNVLLGQGYCTPHGVVVDEYGARVE